MNHHIQIDLQSGNSATGPAFHTQLSNKKIPLIPLLKKHSESINLQLACIQKSIYLSKSSLHTITDPIALDRELNLLQAAEILQTITKSQYFTISNYRNFFLYTSKKELESGTEQRELFFNPWQTLQRMHPPALPWKETCHWYFQNSQLTLQLTFGEQLLQFMKNYWQEQTLPLFIFAKSTTFWIPQKFLKSIQVPWLPSC